MIVSRCCKEEVKAQHGSEGTSWYECMACHRGCDTILSIDWMRQGHDDTRNDVETTSLVN